MNKTEEYVPVKANPELINYLMQKVKDLEQEVKRLKKEAQQQLEEYNKEEQL